jgi:predicted DNA-binding transcriptional regulator AlpA
MDETTTLWTLTQVASFMGVSKPTASRYSRRTGFPARLELSPRTYRFRADEVIAWVESRAVTPTALPAEIPAYLRDGQRRRRAA